MAARPSSKQYNLLRLKETRTGNRHGLRHCFLSSIITNAHSAFKCFVIVGANIEALEHDRI